jgi:hypothetical protein
VDDITQTIHQVELAELPTEGNKVEPAADLPIQQSKDITTFDAIGSIPEEPQFHDAVHTQPDSEPLPRMPHEAGNAEVFLPQPRAVLTPPGQEPRRGVPGPQFAVERSPFLTDEDEDEEVVDSDNE